MAGVVRQSRYVPVWLLKCLSPELSVGKQALGGRFLNTSDVLPLHDVIDKGSGSNNVNGREKLAAKLKGIKPVLKERGLWPERGLGWRIGMEEEA